MRFIREAIRFVVWLLIGWLWLLVVSLVIAGIVAFTVEYFLVTPSSPPFVGYLVSGLSLFGAALIALFSTARVERLGRGVLAATFLLGTLDVATSLLTRFGATVPRIGYSIAIGGTSLSIGSQLVNGVALLAGAGVFVFVRGLGHDEAAETETQPEPEAAQEPETMTEPAETIGPEPADHGGPVEEPEAQDSAYRNDSPRRDDTEDTGSHVMI